MEPLRRPGRDLLLTMSGRLDDTYVAAIQHDLAELPAGAHLVGVVRRATPWFHAAVAENVSALGPPPDLLDEVKDRHETLTSRGLDDATAHNRAMADVDYDDRYRAYLDESSEAAREIERIRDRLASGEDVVLVCYENTDEKHCHRTLLQERIAPD